MVAPRIPKQRDIAQQSSLHEIQEYPVHHRVLSLLESYRWLKPNEVRVKPMKRRLISYVTVSALVFAVSAAPGDAEAATKKWFPGHYLTAKHLIAPQITNINRNLVRYNSNFTGYKAFYTWKALEPVKDRYDFSSIIRDIKTSREDKKKLLIQLSDRVFNQNRNPDLPSYLLTSEYEGGWSYDGRRSMGNFWLPAYQDRWNKLIQKLGEALDADPDFAGVIVGETSGLSARGKISKSYTNERMLQHVMSMNSTAARYLPRTPFFQHVNWGIDEADRAPLMKHIVEKEKGAFGGTDIYDCKKNPPAKVETNAFGQFYKQYRGVAPITLENQPWGYRCLGAREMFDYAVNQIGVNYMVWAPVSKTDWQTKWTIHDAIAVVNANKGKINKAPPSNVF